jgi:hypothetical protein
LLLYLLQLDSSSSFKLIQLPHTIATAAAASAADAA